MAGKHRVVHYLNQFFGQIGGEEKANVGPRARPGAVGPATALEAKFDGQAEVVATVICGDGYFNENLDRAQGEVLELISGFAPDLVVVGPAFNAGRYGVACGAVAQAVMDKLGVPVVGGMYTENPGLDLYAPYGYFVRTRESVAGMRQAIENMSRLALKLLDGRDLASPGEEGYHPRGIRKNVFFERRAAARAVEMLVAKLRGQEFATEFPMPHFDRVKPAPPVDDLSRATIALVTSGGIVPRGNPDRIESSSASRYGRYSLDGVDDLTSAGYETAHGGYDPVYANADPDRVLPVDVMRELEREGVIGKVYSYFYSTVGNGTSVANARAFAQDIAEELRNNGVLAVILTST